MNFRPQKILKNLFRIIVIMLIQAMLIIDIAGMSGNAFFSAYAQKCSTLAPHVQISTVDFQNAYQSLESKAVILETNLEVRPQDRQLRYLGRANIGGEKDKEFWVDEKTGKLWIFKINPYAKESYRPLGVETYYRFLRKYFGVKLEGFAFDLNNRNGTFEPALLSLESDNVNWARMTEDEVNAAFKKFALPNLKKALNEGVLSLESFSDDQIKSVLQQMVIDWLFSNHDAHPANFVVDQQGNIIGIDKEQIFKYFPNDRLGLNYLPNGESFKPLYNLLVSFLASRGKLDVKLLKEVISRINNISEEELRILLMPFALEYIKQHPENFANAEEFITAFLARKNNLESDFKAFFDEINNSFSEKIIKLLSQIKIKDKDWTVDVKPVIGQIKLAIPEVDFKKQFLKSYGSFINLDVEGFKTQPSVGQADTGQPGEFNQQVGMNRELAAMYGVTPEFLQRIKELGDNPEAIAALIDERCNELIAQASGVDAAKLQEVKAKLKGKIRNPTTEDSKLKIILRLLASWVAKLRQQKADFHRVYLARDGGFFYLVDKALEDLSGRVSDYDRGASVYHLSRARMTWYVYNKMQEIITDAKEESGNDIALLYRNIRNRFKKSYKENAKFRGVVDSVKSELTALGYDKTEKIIFTDTGFLGTIPFFLKNVLDNGKNEEELLDETGEEVVQVAIVQPSGIKGFARALFGFDLGMLDTEERKLIQHLADKFDQGRDVGTHLEGIRAHPIHFNENNQLIERTDPPSQLELFYEQILAAQMVIAFHERRAGVEELTNLLPPNMRGLFTALLDKKDFIQFLETDALYGKYQSKIDRNILKKINTFKLDTDVDFQKIMEFINTKYQPRYEISSKIFNIPNFFLKTFNTINPLNINNIIFPVIEPNILFQIWSKFTFWLKKVLGLPFSYEEKVFRQERRKLEKAYQFINADITHPVTKAVIYRDSLRKAAEILGITTKELQLRLGIAEMLRQNNLSFSKPLTEKMAGVSDNTGKKSISQKQDDSFPVAEQIKPQPSVGPSLNSEVFDAGNLNHPVVPQSMLHQQIESSI